MASTNAIKYISNVGRSMGYAAVDVIKEMNPSMKSFMETNNDALKTTYHAIKNIKQTSKTVYDKAVTSRYGEFAKQAKDNLIEDIKTGKIYNRERISKAETAAAMSMLGEDEDFDFSFADDDDSDNGFDFDFESGNADLMNKMDDVGEKSSTAISTVIARSAEYNVQATKELGTIMHSQNAAIYAGLHSNMKTINENISSLIKFASGPVQTHLENSRNFFETETKLSEERNSILKEMLQLQKDYYKPAKTKYNDSDKITMSDVIDSEGMVDLTAYLKRIKQNIKDSSSGTGEMINMLMESGAIETMIASPLEEVAKGAVRALLPKVLKTGMETFNKSLSGLFTSLIANINNMDDYGFAGTIKKLFGIEDRVKTGINTSKYEKGAVPFDGITRKSIIEVIPTYLSKILSALDGSKETRYDYDNGKFVNVEDIQKRLELDKARYSSQASFDLREYLDKYSRNLHWANEEDKEQFKQDLDKILDESYRNGKLFNSRDLKKGVKSYGLKGGKKSEFNLKVIRELFDRVPTHIKLQWAGEMFNSKESQNRDMIRAEETGTSMITALFNESLPKTISSSKEAAPGKGGSIFSNIYNEVIKIRKLLELGKDNLIKTSKSDNTQENTEETVEDKWTKRLIEKSKKVKSNAAREKLLKMLESRKKKTNDNEEPNPYVDNTLNDNLDKSIKDLNKKIKNKDNWKGRKITPNNPKTINTVIEQLNSAKADEEVSGTSFKQIFDDISDANTVGDKAKSILKVPAKFVGVLLKKGENAIYDLIFGKPEDKKSKFRKEIDEVGLGPAILNRLSKIFDKFKEWVKEHIFDPLKDRFGDGKLKEKIKTFFDDIGLTEKFKNLKNKAKEKTEGFRDRFTGTFKKAGKYTKKSFTDVFDKINLNEEGLSASETNDKIQEVIDNLKGSGKVEDIDNSATGMRRVAKTGVVAVSEGEMIIPASLNPYDIKKNLKAENKAKKDFISNFATGGEVSEDDLYDERTKEIIEKSKNLKTDEARKRIIEILEERKKDLSDKKYKRDLLGESLDELENAIKSLASTIKKLNSKEEDIEKDKESMLSTAFGELKEYAPEVAAGGVIGAGVSFIPGVIGGPILGAAVGAGISLIKHSDKVRNMLFGKDDEKGLLPETLSKNIQKYAPAMGKGAIIGAITSILPFVPGGPVSGIILGSALGFASKNEKIQEKLFGEEGLLGPKFKEKVSKALPRMGAGAIVGLIGGPFGIGTNILLGSAVGFATTTDTFKDAFFGKIDEKTGERKGGAFALMVEHLFNPVKEFGIETKDKLAGWAEKYIKQPLKDAADPIKKQFELMFNSITGFFKNAIDRVMDDKIGTPFEKFLRDKLFKPATGLFKNFVKGALMPISFIGSLPGRAVGALGNHYRTKQINSGDATYMTSAQRLLYRHNQGSGIFGRRFKRGSGDRFKSYDEAIYKMDEDQITKTKDILSEVLKAEDELRNPANSYTYENFNKDIRQNKNLSYKETKKITNQFKKVLRDGSILKGKDPEKARNEINKIIANLNLPEEDRLQIAESANKYLASLKDQLDRKSKISDKKSDIMKRLNITDESDIPKIINLLDAEKTKYNKSVVEEEKSKSPEERFNDWESVRHDETISKLSQIRDAIISLTVPDLKAREEFLNNSMSKYSAVDKEISARKEVLSKIKAIVKEEREKEKVKEEAKKKAKRDANKGLGNKLFGNPDIDWKDENSYDAITGKRLDSQVDSENLSTDGISVKGIKGKAKEAFYTFYEGKPIRYIRDRVGKLTRDISDSDTRKTVDGMERERIEKRKFFDNFNGLPIFGKIRDKFFKDDEDDEEDSNGGKGIVSKFLKLFSKSKAGKAAIAAGLTVGIPLLVNFWDKKIWPVVGPILEPLGDNIKTGISTLWDKAQAWLAGDVEGKNGEPGGLPGLFNNLVKDWANGLEIILTKVIPKAAEIIVSCLPTAILNLGKGLVKGFSMSIDNIINAARPSTDPDKVMDKYAVVTKGSTIPELNSPNINGSVISGMDFSAWKLSGALDNISKNKTYSTVDKSGNTLLTASKSTSSSTSAYSGYSDNYGSSNTTTITEGSNVYTIDNSVTYTNSEGKKYTIDELLNSDQIVAYVTDENGNVIPVRGNELLQHPEVTSELGIESRRLTEAERQANADNMGLSDDHTLGGALTAAGVKGFLRGSKTPGNIVGKIGKGIGKIPIVGKYLGYPLQGVGKLMNVAGYAGDKILPEFITGNYTKEVAKNTAQETIERVSGEVVGDNIIREATKKTLSSADDMVIDTTMKEINKESKDGIITRIINWVKTRLSSFFSDSVVVSYFRRASEEMGKLASKETGEAALKELSEKIAKTLAKKLPEKLAKGGGKAIAKATSVIATAGVAEVAFAVAGFVRGWNNANNIIGVANDVEEATGFTKFVCGVVSCLNEVFCFGLLPLSMIFDFVLPLIREIPIFSEKVSDLMDKREKSSNIVAEFNEKNGTNLTVEEYNKARDNSDGGNFVTNSTAWQYLFGKGASIDEKGNYTEGKQGIVQEGLSNTKNFIFGNKDTGEKNIIGKAKDVGGKAVNWVGDKAEDVKNVLNKFGTGISNLTSVTGNIYKSSWNWALSKTDKSASDSTTLKEDDPLYKYEAIISKITDTFMSPLRFVTSTTKGIITELTPVFRFIKALSGRVLEYGSQGLKDAWNGDISSYLDFNTNEETGNDLGGLNTLVKGVTRVLMTPIAIQSYSIGGIVKGITSLIKGGAAVLTNVFESETSLIHDAWNGDIGIIDLFTTTDQDDGEGIVKWISTGVRSIARIFTGPTAALSYIGGKIAGGAMSAIEGGKTAVLNVVKSEKDLMKDASDGSVSLESLFTINNENDGKGLLSGFTRSIRGLTRLFTAPVAMGVAAGSSLSNWMSGVVGSGKSSIGYVITEFNRLKKYTTSDSLKDLEGFWDNPTKVPDKGIFNKVASTINDIMRTPMYIISLISVLANKITNWIGDKWSKFKSLLGNLTNQLEEGGGEEEAGRGSGILKSKKYSARGASLPESEANDEIDKGTFISQIANKASMKKFNKSDDTSNQTLADSGCAPASAAMVVNSFRDSSKDKMTMAQASAPALNYKVKNGGVTADYFENIFSKQGLKSRYIMDEDPNTRAKNIATSLYNNGKVVLMGKDMTNKSKENSPFGPNPHYVVATKMSPDGKYIYVNDPESTKPEIPYPAEKVLSSAQIGISATAANGSGLFNRNKLKKYIGRGSISASEYVDENLGSWSPITVEEMAAWINRVARSNSPWRNNTEAAKVFVDAGNQSGLDPRYLLAHAAIETGWGTSQICRDKNNYFGIGAFDATPYQSAYQFGSGIAAGVIGGAKWIRKNYYDAGQRSVRAMVSDPNGHNYATAGLSGWAMPIAQIMSTGPENTKLVKDNNSYNTTGADTSSSDSSSSSSGSWLDKVLSVFDTLGSAYNLKENSSSSDSSSSSSGIAYGGSDKQNALVAKMKSVEGQLNYSQSQRNPNYGSGDCSSTVQWAYQNVLGVDPGSWTGAQETDSDLYTVTEGYNTCISDPSKLQPGDLVLYRKSDGRSWHVEMYAGNNQLIGHGGGADGTKKGPTVKPLTTKFSSIPYMVRRWTGFRDGAQGSGLDINTFNSNGAFNKQTLRKIQSDKWIGNNQQKVIDRDISKFKEKQINAEASKFSARGNNVAPGKTPSKKPVNIISPEYNIKPTPVTVDKSYSKDETIKALMTMIGLLGKIVDNTSNLQTMISILSEILNVMNEESNTPKTKENTNKIQKLTTKKENLFNKLNIMSGDNETVKQLIKSAEKLARV